MAAAPVAVAPGGSASARGRRRAAEVGWNGGVLHRALQGPGFTSGYLQVQRYLQPLRASRQWATTASVRFETGPGEQGQVDFRQARVWLGEVETLVHLFLFTLSYSRRLWARGYPHERLDVVLHGHEEADGAPPDLCTTALALPTVVQLRAESHG